MQTEKSFNISYEIFERCFSLAPAIQLCFSTFEDPTILLDSGTNLINGDSSLFAIITAVGWCCVFGLGLGLSHQSTICKYTQLVSIKGFIHYQKLMVGLLNLNIPLAYSSSGSSFSTSSGQHVGKYLGLSLFRLE